MPLILAIEPDRKQAGQLTAMVRGRLHAELVLGDSAERALAALGQRIPDLVLTSALLSPKDETALGERLRALDGAAAHVQTLTIPVLASPSRSAVSRAGGMLSALRRDKSKPSAPDGCDPAVFAEQCKEYLERAEADKASLVEQAAGVVKEAPRAPAVPSPVTGSEWIVIREEAQQDQVEEFGVEGDAQFEQQEAAAVDRLPAEELPAEDLDEAGFTAETPSVVLPDPEPIVRPAAAAPPPRQDRVLRDFLGLKDDGEGPASLLAAVAALEAEEQTYTVAEAVEEAPVVADAASDPNEEAAGDESADFDLSSLLDASAAGAQQAEQSDEVEVYELDPSLMAADLSSPSSAAPGDATRAENRSWPILEDLVEEWNTRPSPAPAPAPAAADDRLTKWDDILEALRRDAEQMQAPATQGTPAVAQTEPVQNTEQVVEVSAQTNADAVPAEAADASVPEPEPVEAAAAEVAAPEPESPKADGGKKKKRRAKAHPAQDEWGFFDPEQCGFAALIEKLEEITDKDDTPKPRRA